MKTYYPAGGHGTGGPQGRSQQITPGTREAVTLPIACRRVLVTSNAAFGAPVSITVGEGSAPSNATSPISSDTNTAEIRSIVGGGSELEIASFSNRATITHLDVFNAPGGASNIHFYCYP